MHIKPTISLNSVGVSGVCGTRQTSIGGFQIFLLQKHYGFTHKVGIRLIQTQVIQHSLGLKVDQTKRQCGSVVRIDLNFTGLMPFFVYSEPEIIVLFTLCDGFEVSIYPSSVGVQAQIWWQHLIQILREI